MATMNRDAATELARRLHYLEPDTGNRYAPRSVRTKGAAAHRQWDETVKALADLICARWAVMPLDEFNAIAREP